MSQDLSLHFVCTHHEARKIAFAHSQFWMSNCGCREGRGKCSRSRMDVCLMFRAETACSGSGMKEITLTDVLAIFDEAADKKLVARPFRNEPDRSFVDGICFCCDDCCGYFLDCSEKCDKGTQIESTDMSRCNFCGDCVPACYFGARKMADDELVVNRDECYGCGMCIESCPGDAISMAVRV